MAGAADDVDASQREGFAGSDDRRAFEDGLLNDGLLHVSDGLVGRGDGRLFEFGSQAQPVRELVDGCVQVYAYVQIGELGLLG